MNDMFDALSKLAQLSIIQHQYNEKVVQIKSVGEKRCGNCDHWMKSSCMPEKKYGQFKSMNSVSCIDFVLNAGSIVLKAKFTEELREIEAQLN